MTRAALAAEAALLRDWQKDYQKIAHWHSLLADSAGEWNDAVLTELYEAEDGLIQQLVKCLRMWETLRQRALELMAGEGEQTTAPLQDMTRTNPVRVSKPQ